MTKKYSCLMELRDQIIEHQETIKTPEDPKWEDLSPTTKEKFRSVITWWIDQAQIDLISQIVLGAPGSEYSLDVIELLKKAKK